MPTGCSTTSVGSASPTATYSRSVDSASPTTSGGTLTVMSTASSFVYGSVGDTIDGASLVGGASVGGALPTAAPTVSTKPPKPLTTPLTNGPNAPLRDPQDADPERDDGRGEARRDGSGMPATAVDPAMAREARRGRWGVPYLGGTGRPNDAGRGRTCGGRPPRR